jgi:hypothetical protein
VNVKESMHPRKTTPGGLKEQLQTIVDELRSSMHTSAPRPGLAVIGTGMMGREHIRAVLQLGRRLLLVCLIANPAVSRWHSKSFRPSMRPLPGSMMSSMSSFQMLGSMPF